MKCDVAGLPRLADIVDDEVAGGYSEDFSELFEHEELRLLQYKAEMRPSIENPGVIVFRNKDLLNLGANPLVGNMPIEHHHVFKRFFESQIIVFNPPAHNPLRQIIARPMAPKQIPHLAPIAQDMASRLLNDLIGRGDVNFYTEFAQIYTVRFWGALFDLTEEEMEGATTAMYGLAAALVANPTPAQIASSDDAMNDYMDIMSGAIDRALRSGSNDVAAAMASLFDVVDASAKPTSLAEVIASNVLDGVHTAAVACTTSLYGMLAHPESLAAVRENMQLASNAVTEALRLWPPLLSIERFTLDDIEFADTIIPKHSPMLMLWGAGNRDAEAFENPNQFDLYRAQNGERTFGTGAHICPGRTVAKMLSRVMLETLLAPDIHVEMNGDAIWAKSRSSRHIEQLSVSIQRRT